MLLGEVTATVRRFAAGSFSTGDYVRGSADPDFTVIGSLQPDGDTEIDPLDRAVRVNGRYVFLVELEGQTEIKIADLSAVKEGDRVAVGSLDLVVVKAQDWTFHAEGLPHRRFILERRGDDE